jgi:hypothetical protein
LRLGQVWCCARTVLVLVLLSCCIHCYTQDAGPPCRYNVSRFWGTCREVVGGGPGIATSPLRPAIDPPRTGFAASIDLATRHYCTPTTVSEDRIPEPPGTFLDKPVRHTHTPEASATSRYETFRTSTDPHVWVRLYNMGSVGYSHGRAAPTPPEACAIKPNTKSCTLDRVATNVAHAGYVVASYAAVAILGSPAGAR